MKKKFILIAIVAILLAATPFAYANIRENTPYQSSTGLQGMFNQMTHWMGNGYRNNGNDYSGTGNSYGFMGGMMGTGRGMMGGYNGYTSNPNSNAYGNQPAQYTVNLKILPQGKKGSDGKMHDTYSPADFTLKDGVPVQVVIDNYDDMPHSLISTALGLNIQAQGTETDGQPQVTTFTFTPHNAGDYGWVCVDPCDLEANGWAMQHDGLMKGTIHVVRS